MVWCTRSRLPRAFRDLPRTLQAAPGSRLLNVTCAFFAFGRLVLPLPSAPPSGSRRTMSRVGARLVGGGPARRAVGDSRCGRGPIACGRRRPRPDGSEPARRASRPCPGWRPPPGIRLARSRRPDRRRSARPRPVPARTPPSRTPRPEGSGLAIHRDVEGVADLIAVRVFAP